MTVDTAIANAATAEISTATGKYLYAIVPSTDSAIWQARNTGQCAGIDGAAVYCISHGPLAVVVSDVPNEKIRPERRRLAAHHNILKSLMKECTVLPMSFGIIADGRNAIQRILSLNEAAFEEHLARLEGKMEMGLRVSWDVPNIFEYLVTTHPELRALRDRFFIGGCEPTQEDKIELGRLFGRILDEDREAHTRAAEGVLDRRCFETKRNKPRDEHEIMNLACLIGRDAQKEFEEGVLEAASLFDDNYCFDFNGPWPPHNFVNLELQM